MPKFPPNVIKIDVEGFELEVLKGMRDILISAQLKYLFMEMHFSILADRHGHADAPKAITDQLRRASMHVNWLDPSHLVASRE